MCAHCQARDTASRVLEQSPQNVPALRLLALWSVVVEGSGGPAVKQLTAAVLKQEPRNAQLFYDIAR